MKKFSLVAVILSALFPSTGVFAQPASITWALARFTRAVTGMTAVRSLVILVLLLFLPGGTAHAQWAPTGLSVGTMNVLFDNGGKLFAGMMGSGSVIVSTDGGTSWNYANTGMPPSLEVWAFAVNGTDIFAGTSNGGVFRSDNTGTNWNWTPVNNGLTDGVVLALAVNGGSLFAGTDNGGVFQSTDNGTNWAPVNSGLTNLSVRALFVSGTNLFAGTLDGVFRSTDNGLNWTQVNSGLTNLDVRGFAVKGTYLFAGTIGGIFRSSDNGLNWTQVGPGPVRAFAVDCGTDLYAGLWESGGGVVRSTDNGANWTSFNIGLTTTTVPTLAVSGSQLFAGTWNGGVFRSTTDCSVSANTGLVCGAKFNDLNGDGVRDAGGAGEPGLAGWEITLSYNLATGPVTLTTTTDSSGAYCFSDLEPGMYRVEEEHRVGWHQTLPPLPGAYTVTLQSGQNLDAFDFGNQPDATMGSCIDPPAGLVGWWSGDGHANDLSGFHNNGTLQGGATYGSGQVASAFTLTNAADYVSIPDHSALNFGTSDFSIDAWVRTSPASGLVIVDKLNIPSSGTLSNSVGYRLGVSSFGAVLMVIGDGVGFANVGPVVSSTLNDGNWHFVAATVDRDSLTGAHLYVDGALVFTFNPTAVQGSMTNTLPLFIGQNHPLSATAPAGQIDEVELFDRALSPTEIAALYAAGSAGKCKEEEVEEVETGEICGAKFDDANGDGVRQTTETGLSNWSIYLTGTMADSTTTDAQGAYCFSDLAPGIYTVAEENRTGWHQTLPPMPGTYTLMLASGQTVDTLSFGNQRDTEMGSCIDPPSGLVGWWPGDGQANDLSGAHNDGTLQGGATYGSGQVASAFTLTNAADYVSIPDNSALNFGTSDFSIDAWIRTSPASGLVIVDKLNIPSSGTLSNSVGYRLGVSSFGAVLMVIGDGVGFANVGPVVSSTLNDGNWHFVAATVDRDSLTGAHLYVDGALVFTFNPTGVQGSVTNTLPLFIGQIHPISATGSAGQIDEVEFFDRALSAPEIAALYAAGSAGKCKAAEGETAGLCGVKFDDANGDGVQGVGESGLSGWEITLSYNLATGPVTLTTTTDSSGAYCFSDLGPGTYTVEEESRVGWHQTLPPLPGTYTVTLTSGQEVDSLDFGNQRDATPGCVDPPAGIMGWWPGNGHANDLSGFHNNGTLMGGATYGGGKVANAFTLMNAADYVSIPDNNALNFGTADFSIDAWVKTTDGSNVLNIVDKRTGTSTNLVGYGLYVSGGKLAFQMGDGGAPLNHVSTAPSISDGNWHFVAVTVDRDSTTGGRLYVDNNPIDTFDPTSKSGSVTNTAPLYIGQRSTGLGGGNAFLGEIDEVELFNRALSEVEVLSLVAAGSFGKCNGPCDETPQELPLNTGFDHTVSSPYPVGGNDAFWTIALDADTSRTVPRPAEVITNVTNIWPPAQNDSQWIGPSQVVPDNSSLGFEQNDVGLGDYRYELALCIVGETATSLTFNLSLLADNNATVWLRLPDATRLAVGATSSSGFSTPASLVTTLTGSFVAGTYVLEVDVHNDGISPDFTGINLTGAISGANLYMLKHECCNSSGKLTGTKFSDGNGNGLQDSEPGLPGVVIELLQNGAIVDTTTTDGAGEYFFDVPPGTYTVREVVPMGYTQTSPAGGTYTVTVGPGGIVPNLDFGNQAIPCIGATSQFLCKPTGGRYIQLTLVYNGTVPVSHITVTSLTPGVSFTVTNTPTYPVNQGDTVVLNIDFTGLAAGASAQMLINMDGLANEFGVSESCCDGTLPVVRPGGPGTLLGLYCGPIVIDGGVVVIGNPHVLVDGWVIRMEDQEGRSSTTETDSTGYFVQEGLPVGTYSVSVDLRLGWTVAEPDSGFFLLSFEERDPGASLRFVISPLATVESPIASDFNGDGAVGFGDFFLFADAFGGTDSRFDLDKNGTVDFGDFFIFADSFGGQARAKLMALAQQYIGLPASPRLEPNFPNPFNSSTTIKYYIIEPGRVHLDVFDLTGQKIKSIVDEYQEPGSYKTTWDGTNEQRQPVSTGIYLTKLEVGGFTEMKKMLLMK